MEEAWYTRILLGLVSFFMAQFYFKTDRIEKQQIKDREDFNAKISDNSLKNELMRTELIRHTSDVSELKADLKSLNNYLHEVVSTNRSLMNDNSNMEEILRQINAKLDKNGNHN